ncbi:MAG: hypothetical protein AAF092_17970 [Pseudomonadota bacterium]
MLSNVTHHLNETQHSRRGDIAVLIVGVALLATLILGLVLSPAAAILGDTFLEQARLDAAL